MRSFLSGSCLCLLLFASSCAPALLKGFEKVGTVQVDKSALYPVFRTEDSTQWFNLQIDYKKQHFSGILLLKPLGDGAYRMVFNTHFGMRVFDFELGPDRFIKHACIPPLEKKVVLNTLEKDFSILLFLSLSSTGNESVVYRHKDLSGLEVNKIGKAYYLTDREREVLQAIELPHWFSTLRYDFKGYADCLPALIEIRHSRVGLFLALERISNDS